MDMSSEESNKPVTVEPKSAAATFFLMLGWAIIVLGIVYMFTQMRMHNSDNQVKIIKIQQGIK